MAIGFNTPSKRQAEELEGQNSPQPQQMGEMPTGHLQAQTIQKMQALGDMICSPNFATLPVAQKEMMLIDFAYFTNLANVL